MMTSSTNSFEPVEQSRHCTFADVEAARELVYRHLNPTPLHEYPSLSKLIGGRAFVKHENHHAVGAFKVRGGVNLSGTLSTHEREVGLYTASTGNHGQSIAFAGKIVGAPVRVAVPEGANPAKTSAIQQLGAEVVFEGRDFNESLEWAMKAAASEGARFIGPTDPKLIAGVGTYTLEIMESLPDADVIIVPVGAGSGAASASLVSKTINPNIRVIAVQAERAPAIHRSWKAGRLVTAEMETAAEGIATRVPQENTLSMLCDSKTGIDDFVLVTEDELFRAARLYIEHTRNVAELAGAASLAAAIRIRDQLAGAKVVLVLSGGNISMKKLREILEYDQ